MCTNDADFNPAEERTKYQKISISNTICVNFQTYIYIKYFTQPSIFSESSDTRKWQLHNASTPLYIYTVKPVLRGHLLDKEKVAL